MHARVAVAAALLLAAPAVARAQETATAPPLFPAQPSLSEVTLEAPTTVGDASRAGVHTGVGAGVGFVIGAGATYLALHSGGSTARCDRDANQDAMSEGECLGLTALGGLVGAGIGALVGSRLGSSADDRAVAVAPLPSRGVAVSLAMAL